VNGSRFGSMTVALVAVATLLAACGSSTDTGSKGGASGPTAATDATGAASGGLSTAKAPGVGTVLVNADGFTLYYLETDAHSKVTCTEGCAQTWPPDLVTEVPDGTGLSGSLATIDNPSGGVQLTYEGWPLYTYAGDSGPGQANGEGVGGVWFAMTPDGPGGGGDAGGSKY
jgi:predicted lipoprotein with Yx(FWY)xxD motif